MQKLSLLALAVVAACGQHAADPPTAGSATPGSATPGSATQIAVRAADAATRPDAAPAFCAVEDGMAAVTAFTADDHAATFCVDAQDTKGCATVDLATGAVHATGQPAETPPPYEIKQDASSVQICKAGACVALALPKPPDNGYQVEVNADGTRAIAAGEDAGPVTVLDAQTGKMLKHFKLGDADHPCAEHPYFANDRIYAALNDCNGPGGPGVLYTLDGKKLGLVDHIDTTSSRPLHVDGSQFGFAGRGGNGYEIVDVATGHSIRHASFDPPADCDDKHDCNLLGEGMAWRANALARTTGGKLAVLGRQTVRIVDLATGKVEKSWRIPACPPAK
jgi:hypothetical protein